MIRSYRHKGLKRFAEAGRTGGLPVENAGRVRRALTALKNADQPSDMNLPGYAFHELTGQRKGTYSIRITGNWRLTFRWDDGAVDVDLEDYH